MLLFRVKLVIFLLNYTKNHQFDLDKFFFNYILIKNYNRLTALYQRSGILSCMAS